MSIVGSVGRDRPRDGAALTVVALHARLSSQVRRSAEAEVSAAVARMRDGRRVRLGLGVDVTVSWSHLAVVRSRLYRVMEVHGGVDPRWLLHPQAPAVDGNRRLAPRGDVAVPVGVQGAAGLVLGTSIDLSTSGARLAFPTELPLRPLPAEGEVAQVVLLLAEVRIELLADLIGCTTRARRTRELRVSFVDLDDAAHAALSSAVASATAGTIS